MRALKALALVVLVAAVPAFADQAFEPASAGGVGYPPDPSAPMWDGPEAILFNNGPLVTNPGGGAGGADLSALQTALLLNILGAGHQFTAGNSIADDFTIPAGESWDITNITFFAYQTNSTTASTMTGVYVQIWNGPPNAGGSVIWGDLATNRIVTTAWANMYRASDTTPTNTARPVMASVAAVTPPTLPAGTYWVQWSTDGSLASGPWAPPISILGQTTTGNALQYTGSWAPFIDTGTTGTENFPQGFPFIIEGTAQGTGGGGGGGGGTGVGSEPIPTLSKTGVVILVLAIIGISAILIRRRM
ncbi:MAG TPA: hypothetical protein VLB51_05155 [Methylomirabilota bacterium]|nr:hypothetical protein [Methylomirabilota bacterium]